MLRIQKDKNRDFLILNLTDTHLSDGEWAPGHEKRRILEGTITTLAERVRPDLITVSGDLSYAGNGHAYDMLADFLDSFGIPWSTRGDRRPSETETMSSPSRRTAAPWRDSS